MILKIGIMSLLSLTTLVGCAQLDGQKNHEEKVSNIATVSTIKVVNVEKSKEQNEILGVKSETNTKNVSIVKNKEFIPLPIKDARLTTSGFEKIPDSNVMLIAPPISLPNTIYDVPIVSQREAYVQQKIKSNGKNNRRKQQSSKKIGKSSTKVIKPLKKVIKPLKKVIKPLKKVIKSKKK